MAGAAALCGLPADLVSGLEEAARHMGVLFQIQDDVLDLYGDKGREMRGSDIREGKRSLLVLHALNAGTEEAARWLTAVLDKPRETTTCEEIDRASRMLLDGGALAFAREEMQRRRELALAVPALRAHPALLAVVEAMCELFLEPIAPVVGNEPEFASCRSEPPRTDCARGWGRT
jgi:geranylgeranyl pyrophosphate synthase